MNELEPNKQMTNLVLEYKLEALPQKVWRAISIAEFREQWLQKEDLPDAEPISSAPGKEVSYRMKDNTPPFIESTVTFQISRSVDGGTTLRIIHKLMDERTMQQPSAVNGNCPRLMHAA